MIQTTSRCPYVRKFFKILDHPCTYFLQGNQWILYERTHLVPWIWCTLSPRSLRTYYLNDPRLKYAKIRKKTSRNMQTQHPQTQQVNAKSGPPQFYHDTVKDTPGSEHAIYEMELYTKKMPIKIGTAYYYFPIFGRPLVLSYLGGRQFHFLFGGRYFFPIQAAANFISNDFSNYFHFLFFIRRQFPMTLKFCGRYFLEFSAAFLEFHIWVPPMLYASGTGGHHFPKFAVLVTANFQIYQRAANFS